MQNIPPETIRELDAYFKQHLYDHSSGGIIVGVANDRRPRVFRVSMEEKVFMRVHIKPELGTMFPIRKCYMKTRSYYQSDGEGFRRSWCEAQDTLVQNAFESVLDYIFSWDNHKSMPKFSFTWDFGNDPIGHWLPMYTLTENDAEYVRTCLGI